MYMYGLPAEARELAMLDLAGLLHPPAVQPQHGLGVVDVLLALLVVGLGCLTN